jgi:hypothetical protein
METLLTTFEKKSYVNRHELLTVSPDQPVATHCFFLAEGPSFADFVVPCAAFSQKLTELHPEKCLTGTFFAIHQVICFTLELLSAFEFLSPCVNAFIQSAHRSEVAAILVHLLGALYKPKASLCV